MKATDVLARLLESAGVSQAFGVQGGAVVHVFDSLETSRIRVTYSAFEQSAALAAVAATRISGTPQLCVVTTGPGGTNAITGLLAAWQDSVPTIFLSGQARSSQLSYGTNRRQVGSQEAPILDVVRPITKGAFLVREAKDLVPVVASAFALASSGRPGPVWIDVPVDVQWSDLPYDAATAPYLGHDKLSARDSSEAVSRVVSLLTASERPLLWLGSGSRTASAQTQALVETWQIPFVTTWQTKNFFGPNHELDLGVVGPFGQRGANSATYQADLIIALGSHFNFNQTTGNVAEFCPNARKVVVDVDEAELAGIPVPIDEAILADVASVAEGLLAGPLLAFGWAPSELAGLRAYNTVDAQRDSLEMRAAPGVNSNVFLADLFKEPMQPYDVVVDGGGTALYAGWQCTYGQGLQRIMGSTAISSMGTAFAEAVGVQAVSPASRTFVIIGDGSFWMSLQALPGLGFLKLPVVVIVVNNGGYLAIRHTQKEFLHGRFHGTNEAGGLSFPEIEPVVRALGFEYVRVRQDNAAQAASLARDHDSGVLVLELMCPSDQPLLFSQVFRDNGDGTKSPLPLATMSPDHLV